MAKVNKDDLELFIKLDADKVERLPRDVSPRQYLRCFKDDSTSILMLYSEANNENREELKNFIEIGDNLSAQGLKTPQILEVNEEKCYAVIEDLGNKSFGDCLHDELLEKPMLYTLATDVLIKMRDVDLVEKLPVYKNSRIYENRRQIIDYYMTLKRGKHPAEDVVHEFLSVWDDIENSLPPCPQGFLHGDYHLENLMYAENEQGIRQCALIDYQDALYGPLPYDLVNLVEDARIDVPQDIHKAMLERYCQAMTEEDKAIFLQWFRVLAAQFHGRVIGLFIKLAAEQNRDSYLAHIPRLQNYLKKSLGEPILEPLKAWFQKEGLDFEPLNDLDGNRIRTAFQNTSF